MSRYRKVDPKMWGDAKFRALTPPPPCGQSLWVYLLTGPATTSLPGLFHAGRARLAEELGWSLEGFDKAFLEVSLEGLAKADWNALVVWVPNAKKYNVPENPNVVKHWQDHWDSVPECSLKLEAWHVLRDFTEALGKGFAQAFLEACRKPCPKTMPNQEQEQEQDPDQRSGSDEPASPTSRSDGPAQQTLLADDAPASDPEREVYEHYLAGWRRVIHGNRLPKFSTERRRKVRARLAEKWSVADLKLAVDGLWHSQWHIDNGQTDLELVCRDTKHVEQFLDKLPRDQRPGSASAPAEQEQHIDPAESEADMIARAEQLERERQAMREAKRRNANG
jgi:hypothetical protein